jgi:hypothetical protein
MHRISKVAVDGVCSEQCSDRCAAFYSLVLSPIFAEIGERYSGNGWYDSLAWEAALHRALGGAEQRLQVPAASPAKVCDVFPNIIEIFCFPLPLSLRSPCDSISRRAHIVPQVCLIAAAAKEGVPILLLLRSYPLPESAIDLAKSYAYKKGPSDLTLADAVRACTAAPGYFGQKELGGGNHPPELLLFILLLLRPLACYGRERGVCAVPSRGCLPRSLAGVSWSSYQLYHHPGLCRSSRGSAHNWHPGRSCF